MPDMRYYRKTYAVMILKASLIWERVSRKLANNCFIRLFLRSHSVLEILILVVVEGKPMRIRLWIISLSSWRISAALESFWFIRALSSSIFGGLSSFVICPKDSWASTITARKSEILNCIRMKKENSRMEDKTLPHSWTEEPLEEHAWDSRFSLLLLLFWKLRWQQRPY